MRGPDLLLPGASQARPISPFSFARLYGSSRGGQGHGLEATRLWSGNTYASGSGILDRSHGGRGVPGLLGLRFKGTRRAHCRTREGLGSWRQLEDQAGARTSAGVRTARYWCPLGVSWSQDHWPRTVQVCPRQYGTGTTRARVSLNTC